MAPSPRSRPFTLFDALALVLATAVGLAVTRSLAIFEYATRLDRVVFPDRSFGFMRILDGYSPSVKLPSEGISFATYWSQRVAFWPGPCLAAWTLAVLALALRPPRPPRRRLLRRPGTLAGLAWIASFFAVAVVSPPTVFLWSGRLPPFDWQGWWVLTWLALPKAAGLAVAVSWLTLALSGRWVADRGWPDRLGRALGSCWIGLGVLRLLSSWMWLVT